MTLSDHDHELAATSTTIDRRTTPHGSSTAWWVGAMIALIVAFAGGLALAAILGESEDSTTATETAVLPEYEVDTPVVLYAPPAPTFFTGTDANLDPNPPDWYTTDYDRDTALVIATTPGEARYVGGDANLDPDGPANWQSEYDVDSALVITAGPRATYFVGADANLDPDS